MLTLRDVELLQELQHAENGYRMSLAKLLGSCSPLKAASTSTVTPSNNQLANATRRLVAHHQTLQKLFAVEEYESSYTSLIAWLERGVPVYSNYIHNYTYDLDALPLEIQLRKQPMHRLSQLYKTCQRLELVPESVMLQYEKLVGKAKDTIEKQNLRIDLNTVHFDNVKELDEDLSSTVAYFRLSDVVERDYFEFQLVHPEHSGRGEELVEVFTLKTGTIAICLVQSVGRSLMYPPLRVSEYQMPQNDSECVRLVNGDIELRLRCPDQRQMAHWNQTFTHLSHQIDNSFEKRHAKLSPLKEGKIGLGFHSENETMGQTLRKSSPMIVKHDSLLRHESSSLYGLAEISNTLIRNGSQMSRKLSDVNHYFSASNEDLEKINSYTDSDEERVKPADLPVTSPEIQSFQSPHMQKLEDLSSYVAAIEATFSPEPIEPQLSPVEPLNLKRQLQNQNDSIVSLPNIKHSEASVQLNKNFASSLGDLSRPSIPVPVVKSSPSPLSKEVLVSSTPSKKEDSKKKEKSKRRKSIFGFFGKKNDEPSFEIVTKSTIPASTSSSSLSSSTGKAHPSSMASLHRSVQNISLNKQKQQALPSPFETTSLSTSTKKPEKQLTPLEQEVLSSSSTSRVITNSCIVSRWSQNKWQSIGKQYSNELRFLHNTEHSTLAIFTDLASEIPSLFVPLNNPHTNITKSSALDLQIRCPQTLESTHIHILTVRCCDSKTSSFIMEEFSLAQGKSRDGDSGNSTRETISNSSTVLFDKPSNSTSMSSISLRDDWAPPRGMYGLAGNSNSTLSLKSDTTQQSVALGELLLKSNVKVRLHKQDADSEWMPVSMGKFSVSSSVTNPDYSRFVIKCSSTGDVEALVKNSQCSRLGKSGLKFASIGDEGEEVEYLVEFRNEKECSEIRELLV